MIINKISRFIAGHPKIILVFASLLLIPAVISYLSTFVNYDIMSYLPDSIESVQAEEILDKEFESAANAFLVVENMKPKDIVALKEKIADVKGVSSVIWVDEIVDISIPQSIYPEAITDIFYSTDGDATLIMIQFSQGSATTSTMDAIKEIKGLLNKQCFLSGMSAIIEDTKELTDSEAPKYIAVAIVLALIALSLTMDSWVLPLVLLVSLGYAIIYNMGTNFFMANGISYITQSIAAILQLGVTMDYSVFLMDRFNEEQKLTGDRTQAMANAISSTFVSLLGSSLTTVFGFLALCFMSLTLGFDIGIVMAKGVLLGVITVAVVLPSFMLLFYNPIYRFRHKRIIPTFDKLNEFIVCHSKTFAVIFLCLIIPAYAAKTAVPLDYNISNAMPDQLDSVQALKKLKGDFNMAMTHFVIIDNSVSSGKVSEMIAEFNETEGVSNVISLNSFVGPAISENILPDIVKDICFKNGRQLMMINSVYNTASDEANEQIDKLTSIVKKYDKNGLITGEGVMSKDLITVTDRDFRITSIISIAAIFILIAICFKSFTVPVFLVSAIELAIFLNMSVALITGANVSFIAPTVISCVQLGATVDYAILMTTRFREELHSGKSKKEAILAAANASDKSIFQSSLVFFCATFGVFVTCNIDIVKSICSMLARGAAVSGLVITIFLPALLTVFEGIISKTSLGWRKITKKKSEESE
ncbi:MAG: MMPL family transporter [Clostridia bacterium]|nr:MMPL family transporter [Clostridia bacterium]